MGKKKMAGGNEKPPTETNKPKGVIGVGNGTPPLPKVSQVVNGVDEPLSHHQNRLLAFTPPTTLAIPSEMPDQLCLDEVNNESITSPSIKSMKGEDVKTLEQLPETVERWAAIQKGLHTVAPTCTFLLQNSEEQPAVQRYFSMLVFVLTQGSGKDKLFKLSQNISGLVSSLTSTEETKVMCFFLEDQLSRARKVLRSFKMLSEVNKILYNGEEHKILRKVMYMGNMFSIFYFIFDHLLGMIELGFMKARHKQHSTIKYYKNVFSLMRLITAFTVDTFYYRIGLSKEQKLRSEAAKLQKEDRSLMTDLKAIHLHRQHLRRNFFANFINMSLLLSSLSVTPFNKMSMFWVSVGGIITSIFGLYKVVHRIIDNQLTLQFC